MESDTNPQFVVALREWAEAFMQRSMHGFVAYAKANNLSTSQLGAIFHIHRMGECAVADISEDLGVTNAAVSQMLDRLVQGGLVLREENPHDRRSKRIELTQKGREVMRGTMETRQNWFSALGDIMTKDERATATSTLMMLADRMTTIREAKE